MPSRRRPPRRKDADGRLMSISMAEFRRLQYSGLCIGAASRGKCFHCQAPSWTAVCDRCVPPPSANRWHVGRLAGDDEDEG
jgi:hypothetical protein